MEGSAFLIRRSGRRLASAFLAALLLTACGGGGSANPPPPAPPAAPPGDPPTTPPGTPPTTTFSVSFSSNSASVTADTSSSAPPEDQSITFTATNVPANLYYRAQRTGSGVNLMDLTFTSASSGRVRFVMWRPGQMGAGTYTTNVAIDFCADAACNTVLSGPHNLAVTYVVTGSATPTTQVSINAGALLPTAHPVSQTTPVEKAIGISVQNLPPAGIWVRRLTPDDGVITSAALRDVSFEANGSSAVGFLVVSIAPPAALGSGVITAHSRIVACFDQACTREVPGSEYEFNADLIIHAAESVQYNRRALKPANGATDVIWSQAQSSLYVASDIGLVDGPRILQVDPATGNVGQSVLLSNQKLGRLAVSDDGLKLHVSSVPTGPPSPTLADARVRRLALPAMTEEAAVALDTSAGFGELGVSALVVMPGSNTSFLAALKVSLSDAGIYAYDTARMANGVPSAMLGERARHLTRGATADVFYSYRHGPLPPYAGSVEKLQVNGSGVQVIGSFPLNMDSRAIYHAAGRLYLLDGRVLDADTGTPLGQLQIPAHWVLNSMVVDTVHSRVFAVAQNDYVLSFDMNNFELLALAPLGVSTQRATFDHHIMSLWGTDGLAIVDGTNLVVLSGAFVSTYTGEPTMPLP